MALDLGCAVGGAAFELARGESAGAVWAEGECLSNGLGGKMRNGVENML